MNPKNQPKFKLIYLILTVFLLLQSCQVYHSKGSTVEDAVLSRKKVKVHFSGNKKYKFQSLQKKDSLLVGIVKKKSSTAKEFENQLLENNADSKYVMVRLNETSIEKIQLHNKGLSNGVNFGVPAIVVVGAGALGILILVAYL